MPKIKIKINSIYTFLILGNLKKYFIYLWRQINNLQELLTIVLKNFLNNKITTLETVTNMCKRSNISL